MPKLQNKITSEQILEITKQPQETCSTINKAIKNLRDAQTYVKFALKELKYIEDSETITDYVESIDYELGGIEEDFEFCRSQCEDIRSWGQEWKDLAKSLLNHYEPYWNEQAAK